MVGVDDFMPSICCTLYLIEAQVYNVMDNCLHQDNNSSILLEKNGNASNRKSTKHINLWCFFITNSVNNGEVSVVWCPTGDILGDPITKPIQVLFSGISETKSWE